MTIADFATARLPEGSGVKRAVPTNCEVISPKFWQQYDYQTFFYDVVFDQNKQRVMIYLPRSWGIEKTVKSAKYYIDGRQFPISIFRNRIHIDIIYFKGVTRRAAANK